MPTISEFDSTVFARSIKNKLNCWIQFFHH